MNTKDRFVESQRLHLKGQSSYPTSPRCVSVTVINLGLTSQNGFKLTVGVHISPLPDVCQWLINLGLTSQNGFKLTVGVACTSTISHRLHRFFPESRWVAPETDRIGSHTGDCLERDLLNATASKVVVLLLPLCQPHVECWYSTTWQWSCDGPVFSGGWAAWVKTQGYNLYTVIVRM